MSKTKCNVFVCLFLMLVGIYSCSSDDNDVQYPSQVKIHVGDYPSPISDANQSRSATDDDGNVSWTNGDEILLSVKSKYVSQYVTLTYTDGEWTSNTYIKPVVSADIEAYFAPNFRWDMSGQLEVKANECAGSDEYISYSQSDVNISADGINIDFSKAEREYSRLRVYMGSSFVGGQLSIDGMTPAGLSSVCSITSTIQSNGCAYFYGSFEGNATLTYMYEGSQTTKTTPDGGSINGKGYFNNLSSVSSLRYVDLGLTSGNKWANCNLGAPSSTLSGGYYCWGGTEPSVDFVSTEDGFISQPTGGVPSGSSMSNTIKYTDSYLGSNAYKFPLTSDAANKKLGDGWHVPTYGDWKELVQSCTWTWTSNNGVNGYKITAANGNSIFLPAVGYYSSSSLVGNGEKSLYQCSTVYSSAMGMVYSHFISKKQSYFNTNSTGHGLPIRPVYSEE